jgi:2-C-methyl-D-erythritol 4-phosphate cytidylyltransferase
MKRYAIIVAAGSGLRLGAAVPKQFLSVCGKPILMHTLHRFHEFDPHLELIVALNEDYRAFWSELCEQHQFVVPHRIVSGGRERFHSVKNAVDSIGEVEAVVGIHDAVRPMVSSETLSRCFDGALAHGTAVPTIVINDSIRFVEGEENHSVDRSKVRVVQTPQCFLLSLLNRAFEQEFDPLFTDDASVVEALGEKIHLVEGNRENIKITTAGDLRTAEMLLA